ncbi:MAG: GAF domain-containing protein, partial [Chloroflexi bacterium]|nr:GAF domain-containing protein [Chloroflexota bacterium]
VAYGSGTVPSGRELGVELALEGSFTRLVSQRKSSVIVDSDDVRRQGGDLYSANATILESGIKTSMGFPLISRSEVVGVMILDSFTVDAYTEHHRDLGDLLARNIVGVIVNAQMHRQIQRQAEQRADVRERMATIGRIISSSLNIDDVYESFIEQANGLIPSDRIVVLTLDHDQRMAETAYVWGTDLTDFQPGDAQPVHNTAIQELLDTRKGMLRFDEPLERVKNPTPSQVSGLAQGLQSLIAVPLISGDKVIGGLIFRSKTPSAYAQRHLELAELIAAQIAGAIANAQMHLQIQREAEERAALAEIGRIMNSSIDIQDVYQRFTEVVNRLIPSDRIAVAVLNPQRDAVINAYVWGTEVEGFGLGEATPVIGTAVDDVFKTRTGVIAGGESPQDFVDQFPGQAASISAGLRSMIVVPMAADDKIIGTLLLRSKKTNAYDARDLEIAEHIAAQISGAIANSLMFAAQQRAERMLEQINEDLDSNVRARTRELSEANDSLQTSQEQLRALAARMEMIREEERTHISHEIHDEIGQALTGLKFDISWIGRRMDGVEDAGLRDAVGQRISSIFADIDQNIELVRNLSTRLRPAALDNFGLSAAIESEVQEFQERTGILCEVNTPDAEIDIGKDDALGVFRILQEAMTNAARHAAPTSITVDLEQDSRQIILRVRDDGKGMEDISDTSSLGLLGMKERARLMGGDLVIESALKKGTTVNLRAPIQGQAMERKE